MRGAKKKGSKVVAYKVQRCEEDSGKRLKGGLGSPDGFFKIFSDT
uniref:Uncharacterized protein n=1 Tax=Candidatus Kentrum sp. LPFa TaxID=2126335 RepID=A0A450XUF7_9GAMM|nr:MAG: hypothetical protein BECKLPF1236A_GA0070988_102228 [Candidatus Kentron sp. LPFa]VFK32940.1 MAG: hypothetical protein BECKLPF1236C_GA0070990_101868 [Candidatus Kentron sp. LPFa]